MSAGKCKRGPENPLGATSSSSSGSDDDSPRHEVAVASLATSKSSLQQQQQHHTAPNLYQSQAVHEPASLSPAPAASAHNSCLPATMPIGSTTAQHDFDVVDYDAASSPSGSSTLSGGPVYVRHPGFRDHAHSHRIQQSARRPRVKKKKSSVGRGSAASGDEDVDDVIVTSVPSSSSLNGAEADPLCVSVEVLSPRQQQQQQQPQQQQACLTSRHQAVRAPVVTRTKAHRDPIPMRMRALPQSMWQEPNIPHNVSPATVYPVLPPLVTREGDDITSLRPVTPPDEREEYLVRSDRVASWDKSTSFKMAAGSELRRSHSQHPQGRHQFQQPGERIISVAQPELLQQLFDVLNKEQSGKPSHRSLGNHTKRVSGAKKVMVAPNFRTTLLTGHDPYMVDNIAESLFPQLSLERGGAVGNGSSTSRLSGACGSGTQMVHLQPLPVGDKMIMLPSLIVDQNYPQMLSELVANM